MTNNYIAISASSRNIPAASIPDTQQTINLTVQNAVVMQQQGSERSWYEWTGDHCQAGLGAAIQNLVAGAIIACGTMGVQYLVEKVRGNSNPVPVSSTTEEEQMLKVAAVAVAMRGKTMPGECDGLVDSNGSIKKAFAQMLAKAQDQEPNNYTAYITGAGKCQSDMIEKKHGNPS